jgi:hypothetical protein
MARSGQRLIELYWISSRGTFSIRLILSFGAMVFVGFDLPLRFSSTGI